MDPQPQKSFKRSWWRMPAPDKQMVLFLPTAILLVVLAVLVALSLHRVQSGAMEALSAQGASSEASLELLTKTRSFSLIIYVVTACVGGAGLVWIWWLSVWVFGPYRRLERDLNEVLYGRMDPDQIHVRKGDALYSLVERVRHALTRKPEPPKG